MFEYGIMEGFDADYFNSPAFQQAIAAATQQYSPAPVTAAPVYTPSPVYSSSPRFTRGIGRRGEEDLYRSEVQAAEEVYAPAPVPNPAPAPVYNAAPEPVRGIGRSDGDGYYQQEEIYAPTAGTGLQVVNNATYQPSDTDLEAMTLTRDQWNDAMVSFSEIKLGNLNFGNFGITNPDYTSNFRTFTAPKSNKGNPTSTVAKKDNTFTLIESQPIRLVDQRTGKVIFQGTGYEAADKAIELAAALTKAGGNKADWEIQTGQFKNPGSGDLVFGDTFKIVANEKKNSSILNEALDILGDAALGFIIGGPIGAAIAAGASAAGVNVSDIAYPIIATAVLGPVGWAGVAGAAALGSAVSSVVQGRSAEETLIRAGVTGLTAGLMEGTDIGGRVSDAVGGVLKDIGVESQVGNIISGIGGSGTVDAVTGDIIVRAATDAAAASITSGAVAPAIVDAVKTVVPNYQPSPETEALLNNANEAAAKANEIVVTANPVETVISGSNPIVETAAGIAGGFTGVGDLVDTPELQDKIAEERARTNETTQKPAPEEIVVTATPEPDVVPVPVPETSGIGGIIPVEVPPSTVLPDAPAEEIVVTATPEPEVIVPEVSGIGGGIPPVVTTPPAGTPVDEIVVTAAPEPDAAVPEVSGIGGGIPNIDNLINSTELQDTIDAETNRPPQEERTTLDTIRDAADIASAVLPIVGGIAGSGGGGGTIAPDTSKLTFTKSTLRPTIPAGGIGGTGGRYPYTPQTYGRAGGDQETEYLFFTKEPVTGQELLQSAPAPITTPALNEPAGPAMILPSDNLFAEGGEMKDDMVTHLIQYQKNGGHRGPGQVKGIGSGQEDNIAAYLSDGEYVWSAQDVADLGDGSTDEGVRRLDKMREMVRRQAGRKDIKKIAKPQKGIDRMLKAVGGMA